MQTYDVLSFGILKACLEIGKILHKLTNDNIKWQIWYLISWLLSSAPPSQCNHFNTISALTHGPLVLQQDSPSSITTSLTSYLFHNNTRHFFSLPHSFLASSLTSAFYFLETWWMKMFPLFDKFDSAAHIFTEWKFEEEWNLCRMHSLFEEGGRASNSWSTASPRRSCQDIFIMYHRI